MGPLFPPSLFIERPCFPPTHQKRGENRSASGSCISNFFDVCCLLAFAERSELRPAPSFNYAFLASAAAFLAEKAKHGSSPTKILWFFLECSCPWYGGLNFQLHTGRILYIFSLEMCVWIASGKNKSPFMGFKKVHIRKQNPVPLPHRPFIVF